MKNSTYIKIGLVATFSIVALIWGVNFLKGKGTFDTDDLYYVVYNRIDGLAVNNPVLINGFKVGQVRNIHFSSNKRGHLVVEIAVKKEYRFNKNAVARIFSSDLMGTKAIDLQMGNDTALHLPGDTLIPDFEGSIQEMVSIQMLPLKSKAENLMKEMEDAIEIVKFIFNEETQENITSSFKNIKATFSNLEKSSSNLDSIVVGGKGKFENILKNVESISSNLKNNNQQLTNLINNLENISDSLAKADIKKVMDKTFDVMVQLDTITHKINNGEGSLGLLINNDTLYTNLEDVSYNLNRLVEDLRMNPKKYVHFSAMNFGKTVYMDQNPEEVRKQKQKIIYKIQIKTSNAPIALIPENFNGLKNVEEAMVGGTYIYFIGKKKNLESARSYLKEVMVFFPESFIVEIMGGSYTRVY
ncbi:MAG TPA: MCE family protein [Marinilabiliales bacterium]|nr:MCE family protein [Marinilabiliales bacterium]HBO74740.1 MCE family protein [Marinilabiliales bacterium]